MSDSTTADEVKKQVAHLLNGPMGQDRRDVIRGVALHPDTHARLIISQNAHRGSYWGFYIYGVPMLTTRNVSPGSVRLVPAGALVGWSPSAFQMTGRLAAWPCPSVVQCGRHHEWRVVTNEVADQSRSGTTPTRDRCSRPAIGAQAARQLGRALAETHVSAGETTGRITTQQHPQR